MLLVSEDVAATIPAVATSSMLSICFFAARNEQLHERGYVVFEDALRSNTLSDTQDHLLRYLQYFVAALPNETVLTEHVATSTMEHTEFCFIHNRLPADDPAIGTRGEGRLMTTPHSVSTGLRQQARDVYMSKLWVDLFLAAVAARTLGAVDARGTDIVHIPRTGSRLLVTTKNAERQRPHTDSPIPKDAYGPAVPRARRPPVRGMRATTPPLTQVPDHMRGALDAAFREIPQVLGHARDGLGAPVQGTDGCPASSTRDAGACAAPSYFIMASGRDSFPLWVWPDSHNHACRVRDGMAGWSLVPPHARLITVPPFSVLMVRGDVVHAGAADADDHPRHGTGGYVKATCAYPRNIRVHMYLRKAGEVISDAIYPAPWYYTFLPPAVGESEGDAGDLVGAEPRNLPG